MRASAWLLPAAFLGCSSPTDAPTLVRSSASTSASAAATATPAGSASAGSASADPAAEVTGLPKVRGLTRRQTPAARARADDDACEGGDARACRRVADRFRSYGAPAGCGVRRDRPSPAIKVHAEDWARDHERFVAALGRACQLGDVEACALGKRADKTLEEPPIGRRAMSMRSSTDDNGLWQFQLKIRPEWKPVVEDVRKQCLTVGQWCGLSPQLHRRIKRVGDAPLPTDVETAAIAACTTTHDCDEIMMLLDRSGFRADELTKTRATFGATLREACLAGECTCASALRYTDDEPVRLDLAILGCEDGEPDACASLALRLEEGRGLEKDPERARRLLELACPPFAPTRDALHLRIEGEYSRLACDRLSRLEAGDKLPPDDWERTLFYARRACPESGYELDHAPCVRLGTLWAKNPKTTGRNGEDARAAAWGTQSDPILRGECKRPSVAIECEAFEAALAGVR